jgi:hypothetical protein
VTVPDGAVSGLVTVHTPAGVADSPRPFTVGELVAPPPAEGEGGEPDLGKEQPPEPDPDEHAEAGLSQLSAEQVEELNRQAAGEHEDALAPLHEAEEEDGEGRRP